MKSLTKHHSHILAHMLSIPDSAISLPYYTIRSPAMLHHRMAPTYSCCYALLNCNPSYLFFRSVAAVYSHWDGDERREGGKHWQATLESCEHPPAPTGSRIYLPPLPASDSQVDWFMNLCHHVALLCILFCTVVYRGKLLQTALKVPTALKASRCTISIIRN